MCLLFQIEGDGVGAVSAYTSGFPVDFAYRPTNYKRPQITNEVKTRLILRLVI